MSRVFLSLWVFFSGVLSPLAEAEIRIEARLRYGNGPSVIDYNTGKAIFYIKPPRPGSFLIQPPKVSSNWTPSSPRVPLPGADRFGAPTMSQYNQMQATLQVARDAMIRQQFSQATMMQNFQKLPVNIQPFAAVELEWIQDLNERLTTNGIPPLADSFPALAAGIRDLDALAMAQGLQEFNQALLSSSNKAGALLESLEGFVVDRQGLLSNLPDAPAPVQLLTPWASVPGVRVRNSLNKLMVTKQTVSDIKHIGCDKPGPECTALETYEEQFNEEYAELSLLHGVADRLALASDPGFDVLMRSLEQMTEFSYGIASGMLAEGKETLEFFRHPIDNTKKVVAGLKFAIDNTAVVKAALTKIAEETWEELNTGTSERQGEIIGKAAASVLLAFIPSTGVAKLGKFKAVEGLSKVAKVGTNVAEKVNFLAKSRTFQVMAEATEQVLTSMVAKRAIDAMVATGTLSKEAAKDARALANIFPRATTNIVQNRTLANTLEGVGDMLSGTKRAEALLQTTQADRQFLEWVSREGAAAIEFTKKYGLEAGAGLAQINQLVPGTLGQWASDASALGDLAKLSTQVQRAISDMPPSRLDSLGGLVEAFRDVAKSVPISDNAVHFLAYQAVNASRISTTAFDKETFTRMAQSYLRLEREVAKTKGVPFEGTVWRGIASESVAASGNVVLRNSDDVYAMGPWNKMANHRYSAPGEMGLYVSTEVEAIAKDVIVSELAPMPMSKVVFKSRTVNLKNVLDATGGRFFGDMTISNQYELTHQLGHISRRTGFDGILYAPARMPEAKPNLVIFGVE